jgi:hypothetical protein
MNGIALLLIFGQSFLGDADGDLLGVGHLELLVAAHEY